MPQISRIEIAARDGFPLAANVFEPIDKAAATVLLLSATGVKQNYYRAFAEFLAEHALRVVTFDYRGIGSSRPRSLRGFAATMHDWATLDANGVRAWIETQHPQSPLLSVGHSFGGQALGLLGGRERFRAALFVASQSGYWGHWPAAGRLPMLLLWYLLIPSLSVLFGYFPGRSLGMGADLPAGVARQWACWGRHPSYLFRDGGQARQRAYGELTLPILAYSFSDDSYAPRGAVEALLERYETAAVEHRHVQPTDGKIGHFGFFRDKHRQSLWRDSHQWFQQQISAG